MVVTLVPLICTMSNAKNSVEIRVNHGSGHLLKFCVSSTLSRGKKKVDMPLILYQVLGLRAPSPRKKKNRENLYFLYPLLSPSSPSS